MSKEKALETLDNVEGRLAVDYHEQFLRSV